MSGTATLIKPCRYPTTERLLGEYRPPTNKPGPHCPLGYIGKGFGPWETTRTENPAGSASEATTSGMRASPKPGNSPKKVKGRSNGWRYIGVYRRNTIEIQWQVRTNGRRREGRWTPIRAKAQDTRANPISWKTHLVRPAHLQIPGGPEMARAALLRRAIDGPFAVM